METINLKKLKFSHELTKKVLSFFKNHEELNELAENSILPHYRLVHPITKATSYLFDSDNILEYLISNCITEVSGKELTVLRFGDNYLPSSNTLDIPDELVGIDNKVYNLPMSWVDTPSGIYFLYLDSELVYIGQTQSIAGRVCQHIAINKKLFNKVYYIRVDSSSLDRVEVELINRFRPKYNTKMRNLID
jgi:hypothetical protein